MTRYLTVDDVLTLHEDLLGPDRLGDFGRLEAAVLRPQQSAFGSDAFPDIHTKSAALLHGLIRGHAFLDGNKRIGAIALGVFYSLNGYWLEAEDGDLYALCIDVAIGMDLETLASRLQSMTKPVDPPL